MIKKNIIQYLLLIALVILSFFFYKKYIETDKDVSQKQSEIQKKYENPVNEENDETSNTIENLKYVSKDLLGNTYIITAQSAEIEENKVDRVQLVEVLAKIIQQDD